MSKASEESITEAPEKDKEEMNPKAMLSRAANSKDGIRIHLASTDDARRLQKSLHMHRYNASRKASKVLEKSGVYESSGWEDLYISVEQLPPSYGVYLYIRKQPASVLAIEEL